MTFESKGILEAYASVAGEEAIEQLRQLAKPLQGARVVQVNSTRVGGGVAEILLKLVPLLQELGLESHWEVIAGDPDFYQCTKGFHNALQGNPVSIPEHLIRSYEETNARNAERLRHALAGVIQAYRLVKKFLPGVQLVLAGGGATDDPEGEAVLAEIRTEAEGDPDLHILLLPPDAHRTINALQRVADIVLQKSTREGFGLTVTEALWKGKPVIGGETGGIRLQVINHHTGFLVNTPEGAALWVRYLLHRPDRLQAMGHKAKEFVRENFLLPRQVREHLTLIFGLLHGDQDRIELN